MVDAQDRQGFRLLLESEREIMPLVRQGCGSIEIAEILAIRTEVLDEQIEGILKKLALDGRLQLWQYATTHPRPRALQGGDSSIVELISRNGNGAGLRRVAAGLLDQARQDLSDGSRRATASAVRWIAGSLEGGLSFSLCCRLLDRLPDSVRRGLLNGSGVAANGQRNFRTSREFHLKAA